MWQSNSFAFPVPTGSEFINELNFLPDFVMEGCGLVNATLLLRRPSFRHRDILRFLLFSEFIGSVKPSTTLRVLLRSFRQFLE